MRDRPWSSVATQLAQAGELRPIGSSFQHGQSRGQTHAHSMQRLRRRFQRFFGVKQANKAKHLPALRNSSSPTESPKTIVYE